MTVRAGVVGVLKRKPPISLEETEEKVKGILAING